MNIIQQIGTWQEQCQTLNYNFRLIATEIDKLKEMASKDAGFYDTATDLLDAFPVAEEGMRAFVKGENYSGTYDIYGYHEGSWADTGENFTTSVYLFDVVKRVFLGNSQAPVIPSGGDVTIPLATASAPGLFSATDKVKIDGLPNNDTLVSALANKVDKVAGKGLSENDFTTTEKNKLAALPTSSELNTTFGGKVDNGKGILALALAAGFTYDAQTGTYTHRFLSKYDEEGVEKDFYMTGLTETDVAKILRVTARPMQRYGWWPGGSTMQRIKCTAEINGAFIYRPAIDTSSLCHQQFDLEVFWPCDDYRSTSGRAGLLTSNATSMFNECRNLRRTTAIDVKDCTSVAKMFAGCSALVETRIFGLNQDISFVDSPNLSLRSLEYLVEHAANTGAITVLVHPYVYDRLEDDWRELEEAAALKNISLATV